LPLGLVLNTLSIALGLVLSKLASIYTEPEYTTFEPLTVTDPVSLGLVIRVANNTSSSIILKVFLV